MRLSIYIPAWVFIAYAVLGILTVISVGWQRLREDPLPRRVLRDPLTWLRLALGFLGLALIWPVVLFQEWTGRADDHWRPRA